MSSDMFAYNATPDCCGIINTGVATHSPGP
jgi:hypothetical protein